MIKKILLIVFISVQIILLSSCTHNKGGKYSEDLDEIIKRDTLRALTIYSSTSYFLYRGKAMGFEYDLLKNLADYLNLELKIIIAENQDNEIQMLKSGKADIIAHGLAITNERRKHIAFTLPIQSTHQTLVQRKPDNWRELKLHEIKKLLINDPIQLKGKEIHVRKESSYYDRLRNLSDELGVKFSIIPETGNQTTEDLIKKVVDKEINYTIADYNIASINKSYYPILNIDMPISLTQNIAWATRINSSKLLDTINYWLNDYQNKAEYYVIYNKYFKNSRSYRNRLKSDFYSLSGSKISEYDEIIKKYSEKINWDWRLISSLIYQESRFKNNNKSWAGAKGLMQMMPATAKHFGVKNILSPEQNIAGGTKYLLFLEKRWEEISDSIEKQKFVLASYNVGPNHVADARRLAEKYDNGNKTWEHVSKYLKLKSDAKYFNDEVVKYGYCRGSEPVKYVKEIIDRYEQYKTIYN